jgi:hypothetical protein
MTSSTRILAALVVVVALEGSLHAVAIKETVKLTISGPGLSQSLEVSDPPVLALSNVYAGTFIGALATAPDPTLWRYTVTFNIQTAKDVRVAAYTVQYVRGQWTGEGFIYLPGRGDESYRRNIFTILRDGQDGTWRYASPDWSAAINAHLP